jgi:hypothetical protein
MSSLLTIVFVFPGVEGSKLELSQLPMMITITFNGAINNQNMDVYNKLFHG